MYTWPVGFQDSLSFQDRAYMKQSQLQVAPVNLMLMYFADEQAIHDCLRLSTPFYFSCAYNFNHRKQDVKFKLKDKMAAKDKRYAAWIPLKRPSEVHRFVPSEFFYT